MTTHDEESLRGVAHETLESLAAFRDDVRVRIHLAGMEAKDLWREAEPTVEKVEGRLKKVLDQVGVLDRVSAQQRRTIEQLNLGDVFQWHQRAAGAFEDNVFKGFWVFAIDLRVAKNEREAAFALGERAVLDVAHLLQAEEVLIGFLEAVQAALARRPPVFRDPE